MGHAGSTACLPDPRRLGRRSPGAKGARREKAANVHDRVPRPAGKVGRIFAEGHTIGSHGEDHPLCFGKLPSPLVEWEIDKGILDVGAALRLRHFFAFRELARSEVIENELAAEAPLPKEFLSYPAVSAML